MLALVLASAIALPLRQEPATLSEARTLAEHASPVVGVFYTNKGKSLATVSAEGEFKVWDRRRGKESGSYTDTHQIADVALCKEKHIVFVAGSTIGMVDARKGKFGGSVAFGSEVVRSVCHVPKFSYFFIGYEDGEMRRMPDGIGMHADQWSVGQDHVLALAAHPKGKEVIAGTSTGRLVFIDSSTLEILSTISTHTGPVTDIVFGTKGSNFYTAGIDKTLRAFDFKERKQIAQLDVEEPIHVLALSLKKNRLATGDAQGTVRILDAKDLTLLGTFEAQGDTPVRALAFDSRGNELAVGGLGNHVILVDVSDLGK